ncbi:Polyketide cyclase/dehydrase and lipid transport superfamily protein [Thalictrum thalictroides]|uniref:Polyketide cyclase/dehydrase and lipid transport superfamily protein n=1 Tax=Thalictrum thalictroides TaxID=46969 RepID=A0A7J6UXJ6_THATH|nr:Polyketide cyclase/dehydrase and lipid transport superfamily protein [Thalictrum thalictroides]
MNEIYGDVMDFLKKPAIFETFVDILLCAVPIWVAVMIGLVIGWSWRPRWTGLVFLGFRSRLRFLWTAPPGFGARRLWFAFTAVSAFSVGRRMWFNFKGKRDESDRSESGEVALSRSESREHISGINLNMEVPEGQHDIVTKKDLDHLLYLLEGNIGDVAWQNMMERSTPSMAYQAWRHEPETGPTIYRTKTVYEDVSPELVRDFFWDDEFRPKWDPMLAHFKLLEECPHTGTMIVHWIKKFPFFCSDREYIIGRRIWESGKTYYCLTKGVPYPGLPKRDKPRRVELYFSSWIIKPVQSRKEDGQLSACEVSLVHYEDMGIPKDVAKLGVRHGMWGTVKKVHSGMRAYQLARKCEASLSRSARMAQITTKIPITSTTDSSESPTEAEDQDQREHSQQRLDHGVDWRWAVVGGTIALVCGLHTGVIGKTLLFGAARRLARR